MSLSAWLSQHSTQDARLIRRMAKDIRSFGFDRAEDVIDEVAALLLRWIMVRYGARSIGAASLSKLLDDSKRFDGATIEHLVTLFRPLVGRAKAETIPISKWPDILDWATPLLDILIAGPWRKPRGFFCTPPDIAAQLVDELKLESAGNKARLFEPGAGSGALALLAARRYVENAPSTSDRRARFDTIFKHWCVIEKEAGLHRVASLLWLSWCLDRISDGYGVVSRWPVVLGDAFRIRQDGKRFTHSIGNPPYLGEKQARAAIRDALEKRPELSAAYTGKADLSFLFVAHAVRMLAPGGRLAYLTPAYWPTADGAAGMRRYLEQHCKDIRVQAAMGRILSTNGVEVSVLTAARGSGGSAVMWKPAREAWVESIVRQMGDSALGFGSMDGPFAIHAGIQSGADELGVRNRIYCPELDLGAGIYVLGEGDANALKQRMSEGERACLVPLDKSPDCGPYLHRSRGTRFLLYLDGSVSLHDLPTIREHLKPFKPLLEQRRECRDGRMPWWRLHWPRKRAIFTSAAILAPQRAAYPRFGLALEGAYTSVDVYHLSPKAGHADMLFAWLAILHSLPVYFWLMHEGKRKGDLLELYHTPLSNIPVPESMDSQTLSRLNRLGATIHDKMVELAVSHEPSRPWHLVWRDLLDAGSLEVQNIRHLLDEADEHVSRLYGFSDEAVKRMCRWRTQMVQRRGVQGVARLDFYPGVG